MRNEIEEQHRKAHREDPTKRKEREHFAAIAEADRLEREKKAIEQAAEDWKEERLEFIPKPSEEAKEKAESEGDPAAAYNTPERVLYTMITMANDFPDIFSALEEAAREATRTGAKLDEAGIRRVIAGLQANKAKAAVWSPLAQRQLEEWFLLNNSVLSSAPKKSSSSHSSSSASSSASSSSTPGSTVYKIVTPKPYEPDISPADKDPNSNPIVINDMRLIVKSARNLIAADKGGTSDPYVKIRCYNRFVEFEKGVSFLEFKTKTVKKDLNPEWNESFLISPLSFSTYFVLEVYDRDLLKDDLIGTFEMTGRNFNHVHEGFWFPLSVPANLKSTHSFAGEICLGKSF